MVDSHVIPDGSTPNQVVTETIRVTESVRFSVAASTMLTAVRWHRYNLTTVKPNALCIWSPTGQLLQQLVPNDLGTVGWQNNTLATPIQLFPGQIYAVGGDVPVGYVGGRWVPHHAPDSGITWQGSYWSNNTGGTNPNPVNSNGDNEFPFDAVMSPPPDVVVGATNTDVRNDLAGYLSESDATRSTSIPANTEDKVDALTGAVLQLVTMDLSAPVLGRANTIASTISSIVTIVTFLQDHGLPNIQGWINGASTTLQGKSDALASTLNDANTALASGFQNQDRFRDNAGGGGGVWSDPGSPWTLADETDWAGALAWPVKADLYVLTVTELAGRTPVDVAGVGWYPRLGWWATLDGTQVGCRRYFDFAENQLRVEGGNMPGVLLKTSPLMSGHIQAWRHS